MAVTTTNWGLGPYGMGSYGGTFGASPGGHIPAGVPFDIYQVDPYGPMSVFDSYIEVEVVGSGAQAGLDTVGEGTDYRLHSGLAYDQQETVRVLVHINTPQSWTYEVTFVANQLPDDLGDVASRHIYFGAVDQQGVNAGVFLTRGGIYYTGSVDHDGNEKLHINGPLQLVPETVGLLEEGVYYTLRIAADLETQTTYLYLTKTVDLPVTSHKLLAILPALWAEDALVGQTDGTVWSVAGTVDDPVDVQIHSYNLGEGLIIPNFPPVASAGRDQVVRSCVIAQLDGTESFDPEGSPVTYAWRLIAAPGPSTYCREVDDGATFSPPATTNKFHSSELAAIHQVTGISAGDVLVIGGVPHTVTGTGVDGNGFYVEIDDYILPAPTSYLAARLLFQRGLKDKTTAKPTFYPDVPGLYRFELTVSDGQYRSEPSEVLVNVTDSPLPRGVVPDVSFLWNYLLDFWNMVEDREQITTFWQAMAQVCAGELLSLWQHDYGKSLRDVQRLFNRKWLHYDLYLPEPATNLTKVVAKLGGIESHSLTDTIDTVGLSFQLQTPFSDDVSFSMISDGTMTPEQLETQLRQKLTSVDKRFEVTSYVSQDNGLYTRIGVWAPFAFTLTTTTDGQSIFWSDTGEEFRGTNGTALGSNLYHLGRIALPGSVDKGDYLVVNGVAHRILSVQSDASDLWPRMRVALETSLPAGASSTWYIPAQIASPLIDYHGALVSEGDVALLEVLTKTTGETTIVLAPVRSAVEGSTGLLLVSPFLVLGYLALEDVFEVRLRGVQRRTHLPLDPLVASIPYLQEKIVATSEAEVLHQNVDYFLEEFRGRKCIRFVTPTYEGGAGDDIWEQLTPPARLWAEFTYLDNRPQIEANFGLAVDFTLDDLSSLGGHADYLSVVRGLWYTHLQGPTLRNLRVGAQILLGLPFAEEPGIIVSVDETFSAQQGRILVRDVTTGGLVRSYEYPRGLTIETNPATGKTYVAGDRVEAFAPLVEGVEVDDYLKNPTWFRGYINQGLMLEVEKLHTFLVRIDSKAFSLNTLVFVQSFIKRIKPRYTHPLFLITADLGRDTTVSVTAQASFVGALYLSATPSMHYYGNDAYSATPMFDGIIAGPASLPNVFDGNNPNQISTYPSPAITPIKWGYDKRVLTPESATYGLMEMEMSGEELVAYDSGLWTTDVGTFSSRFGCVIKTLDHLLGQGNVLGSITATGNTTIEHARIELYRNGPFPDQPVEILVRANGSTNIAIATFTIPAGQSYVGVVPLGSTPINDGDVIEVILSRQLYVDEPMPFTTILVDLGIAQSWTYDTPPPAGTYSVARVM